MAKWYAVQSERDEFGYSNDSWDFGSFDYSEAVRMLLNECEGQIAVIEGDICTEEITFWDAVDTASDADIAMIVKDEYNHPENVVDDLRKELCYRAGKKLGKMIASGQDCTEILSLIHYSVSEEFLDTKDVDEVVDWLKSGAEQAETIHLYYALEEILGVDLV